MPEMGGANRYVLIVNPAAGRGRAGKLLPRAEQAFAVRGLAHRTLIRSEEHTSELQSQR